MGSVKIAVFGRIKPCSELSKEYQIRYGEDGDDIMFSNTKEPSRSFRFKKVFGENATQAEVFESVAKPITENFLSGCNATIFTYGQTGSGKTYTMIGDVEEWVNPGLIPRMVQEIFNTKGVDMAVTMSYCEIYNERIYDLIKTNSSVPESTYYRTVSLTTEPTTGSTNSRYLSVHQVKTAEEALRLFLKGEVNKTVAASSSNLRSSRSHTIFFLGLDFPHPSEENVRLKPALYLVDLAGSEKLSKNKTPTTNVSETRFINLSLHYLEQVLIALGEPGRAHIPYRNSLMTALLKNSLGGNSVTVMIATFSVSRKDIEETAQTCKFSERISMIRNEVKLMEVIKPQKEIDYLRKENERLKAQLKLLSKEPLADHLDEKEKKQCLEAVQNFIQENNCSDLPLDNVARMEYCFQIMRDKIIKNRAVVGIKSKESQLELFHTMKSAKSNESTKNLKDDDYWPLKMAQLSKAVSADKSKRHSTNIPKVNIIYENILSKQSSKGKENNAPKNDEKINTNKVKVSNVTYQNSAEKTKQSKESSPVNESSHSLPKQNEPGSGVKIENITSNMKIFPKNNENNNSSCFTLPAETITSTEGFNDTNLDVINVKNVLVREKMSSESELQKRSEKISSVLSSISSDFKAFTTESVPLTGDEEVDEEIIKFYKSRYEVFKNK